MSYLSNTLSGISITIDHIRNDIKGKVSGLVNQTTTLSQSNPNVQSDCPYIFGMGCKLKHTVDSLSIKLDDLSGLISNPLSPGSGNNNNDNAYDVQKDYEKFYEEMTKEINTQIPINRLSQDKEIQSKNWL